MHADIVIKGRFGISHFNFIFGPSNSIRPADDGIITRSRTSEAQAAGSSLSDGEVLAQQCTSEVWPGPHQE